ncbi:hypothetical protein ACV334_39205, partial [Pseudomonas aeruginosa]
PRNRVGLSTRIRDTPGKKDEGKRGERHAGGGQPRQERGAPRAQSAQPADHAMAAPCANATQLKKKWRSR